MLTGPSSAVQISGRDRPFPRIAADRRVWRVPHVTISFRAGLAAVASTIALAACTSTTAAPNNPTNGNVAVSSDVSSILNSGAKANLIATATDAAGKAGTGAIKFSASFGDMNGTG